MELEDAPFSLWFKEVVAVSAGEVDTSYKGIWYETFEAGLTPEQAVLSHMREAAL